MRVGFTTTYLFHFVAGIVDTVTRVPVDAPLVTSTADPHLKIVLGIVFLSFISGASWQVVKLRTGLRKQKIKNT
ncbi:MAG TPA: hypothetical protein VKG26_08825 [Bacteroidia bacterium]|nr:hypothetical protein [Bacteroidia bacterium]